MGDRTKPELTFDRIALCSSPPPPLSLPSPGPHVTVVAQLSTVSLSPDSGGLTSPSLPKHSTTPSPKRRISGLRRWATRALSPVTPPHNQTASARSAPYRQTQTFEFAPRFFQPEPSQVPSFKHRGRRPTRPSRTTRVLSRFILPPCSQSFSSTRTGWFAIW